jgi:hypothetical protein
MKIQNLDGKADVSDVLDLVAQFVRERGASCEAIKGKDDTKGSLVVELIITLTSGVATSVIYDALKVAILRARQGKKFDGNAVIEIDGKKYTLTELEK